MSIKDKKRTYREIPFEELKKEYPTFYKALGRVPSDVELKELETGNSVSLNNKEATMYEEYVKQKEGDKNMGTTPNYQKKEKEYEERKATRGMEEQQPFETDLDFKMRVDAAIESRRMEEAHKDNLEKQEKMRNQLDAEEKDKKERILAEEGFTGETELHKQIRLKLYAGGIPEEERQKLREQYHLTPYQMPYKVTVRKTIIYDCDNGLTIQSTDNGKHWTPRANADYFKSTPRIQLDPTTGKPIGYIFDNFNDSIYNFIRTTQPAEVKIVLEEDMPVDTKTVSKPVPRVLPTCDDIGQEHKFVLGVDKVNRCCLCGKVKEK